MPDPKLKAAMEEIKVVLRKHDIGGVAILSSEKHSEYLVDFEATWNALRNMPDGLRFLCKRENYPTQAAQKITLANSIGALMGTVDVMYQIREALVQLLSQVAQDVEFSHVSKNESKSYSISPDGKSITCNRCTRTSHNINDVRNLYCANCNTFHQL